jgi:predicted nuclease of predicted toxin-antitoxin system
VKRLLLDQGLPKSTAALLVREGWDACHVADVGMSRASDVDILDRAEAEGRVCVTLDADFHALLATGAATGPSVVRIRKEGLDAAALAQLLEGLWPRIESALEAGAMVVVTERSVRIRRLPIGGS